MTQFADSKANAVCPPYPPRPDLSPEQVEALSCAASDARDDELADALRDGTPIPPRWHAYARQISERC